jgi:CRISPR/Cas system-associated exonuclease Cas4 (RecB family)
MATPIPWSYSSLQQYETCPRRFKLTRIEKKVKEPMSESMTWGNEVHKALELALKGTNGLTPKFVTFQPLVDKLRAAPGEKEAERNFALTSAFTPTDYWAKDAWVRGKADVTITNGTTGFLFDYKTGKPKEDSDQLNLFAAVLFAEKPYLQKVHTGYIWVAHDKIDQAVITKDQVPIIWQGFVPRVQRMVRSVETGDFPPRPSGLCKAWCPVGKALCEFCGV